MERSLFEPDPLCAPWIVFEGIDGSGKSTQARLLAQHLDGRYTHIFDTPSGMRIRDLFLETAASPLLETLILLAAREAYFSRFDVCGPLRQPLITDRYLLSITSMQCLGRPALESLVSQVAGLLKAQREPDLTIVLDVPASVARARRSHVSRDRIEARPLEFHEAVRQRFLQLASADGSCVVLDGSRSVQEVHDDVVALVRKRDRRCAHALAQEVAP